MSMTFQTATASAAGGTARLIATAGVVRVCFARMTTPFGSVVRVGASGIFLFGLSCEAKSGHAGHIVEGIAARVCVRG